MRSAERPRMVTSAQDANRGIVSEILLKKWLLQAI